MKKCLLLTIMFIGAGSHQIQAMKEDSSLLIKIEEEKIETISEFMEVVRLLGEQGKPLGNSLLHDAVFLRQYKIVKQLLDNGIDANIINFVDGKPPLFFASREDIAELLLGYGAQVKLVDHFGSTVLHSDSSCYLLEMTEWFIAHGAEVNAVDKLGQTPLHRVRRKGCTEKLL